MIYENLVSLLGQDEMFSIDSPLLGADEHRILAKSGGFYAEKMVPAGVFAGLRYPDRVIDEVWLLLKSVRAIRASSEAKTAAATKKHTWVQRTWNFLTRK